MWVNTVSLWLLIFLTSHNFGRAIKHLKNKRRQLKSRKVGQQSRKRIFLNEFTPKWLKHFRVSLSHSSAPSANGFSQMARMMDSLILDSLSTTPYAFTKITTHRPVKKATSTTHLPSNGGNSSTAPRNSTFLNQKKIPTQGRQASLIIIFHKISELHGASFTYFLKRNHKSANASFASSQVYSFALPQPQRLWKRKKTWHRKKENFLTRNHNKKKE